MFGEASRVEPRDYADVAAALQRYSPAQLIGFARRLDPGLTGRDFADAGLRLDRMDDRAFADIGLSHYDVARLRERLAAWPRDAHAADQERQPGNPAEHRRGHQQTPTARRSEPGAPALGAGPGRQQQPGHGCAAQAERDDPEAEP